MEPVPSVLRTCFEFILGMLVEHAHRQTHSESHAHARTHTHALTCHTSRTWHILCSVLFCISLVHQAVVVPKSH